MESLFIQVCRGWLILATVVITSAAGVAAEPKVQILSPQNGARISQEEQKVLLSGKVSSDSARPVNVDVFLSIDVSLSTAHYAGVNFPDLAQLPGVYISPDRPRPRISLIEGEAIIRPTGEPPRFNLRNSIFAAEIVASLRLLSQLDSKTTRVGVITFSDDALLRQPLTHDFEQVRKVLEEVYRSGPYGGTNMVEGIRLGIKELLGLGRSEMAADSIKTQFLLTDGLPSLPIGEGKRSTREDTDLAINAARMSGKAGMKVHVFALGKEIVDFPYAATGIARESGGSYTPLQRPADLLVALENVSVVDVHHVQVTNLTTDQKAMHLRLAADGFFAAAVPLAPGLNQLEVSVRASGGSTNRAAVTVYFQAGTQPSLDLEVFLEKQRKLEVEIQRLGKSWEEIQQEAERLRQGTSNQTLQPPPATSDHLPR